MGDLSIFFSYKSILIFLLVLSRISGMIFSAPLFSTYPIPSMVKALMSAVIAFTMFPMLLGRPDIIIPHDLITLTLMLFKELFVGILIGFCAGLVFVGIQLGGQILSQEMGLSAAETMDPVTGASVSVVGEFYILIASILFVLLNGHHWLFETVYNSYNSIPIGLDLIFTGEFVQRIIYFVSQIFVIAFSMIMPIFGILFIVTVAMAFLSKLMPQMNVFVVALPIQIYVGLMCLSFFMVTIAGYITKILESSLGGLKAIFG